MITPSILYKQMKNWVAKKDTNNLKGITYIHFDGERALATSGNVMAIVKDWPSDPHVETPDGIRPSKQDPFPGKFPNYQNLLLPEENRTWKLAVKDPSGIEALCKEWKQVFTLIRNLLRRPKETIFPVTLRMHGGKVSAYTATETMDMKFVLLEKQEGEDWEQAFSAACLLNAMEFLLATSPKELSIYNGRSQGHKTLHIETEDILLLIAGVNVRGGDEWSARHCRFVNEERLRDTLADREAEQQGDEDFLS